MNQMKGGGSGSEIERNGSGRRVLNATQSHSLMNLKSSTNISISSEKAVPTTQGGESDTLLPADSDHDCLKEFEYLNQTYYSPTWLAPLICTNAPSVCCASSASSPGSAYQSFTWCFDRCEPLLMFVFSIVGINLELWLHPGMVAWRTLYCSCTGEVIEENVNVWQHR